MVKFSDELMAGDSGGLPPNRSINSGRSVDFGRETGSMSDVMLVPHDVARGSVNGDDDHDRQMTKAMKHLGNLAELLKAKKEGKVTMPDEYDTHYEAKERALKGLVSKDILSDKQESLVHLIEHQLPDLTDNDSGFALKMLQEIIQHCHKRGDNQYEELKGKLMTSAHERLENLIEHGHKLTEGEIKRWEELHKGLNLDRLNKGIDVSGISEADLLQLKKKEEYRMVQAGEAIEEMVMEKIELVEGETIGDFPVVFRKPSNIEKERIEAMPEVINDGRKVLSQTFVGCNHPWAFFGSSVLATFADDLHKDDQYELKHNDFDATFHAYDFQRVTRNLEQLVEEGLVFSDVLGMKPGFEARETNLYGSCKVVSGFIKIQTLRGDYTLKPFEFFGESEENGLVQFGNINRTILQFENQDGVVENHLDREANIDIYIASWLMELDKDDIEKGDQVFHSKHLERLYKLDYLGRSILSGILLALEDFQQKYTVDPQSETMKGLVNQAEIFEGILGEIQEKMKKMGEMVPLKAMVTESTSRSPVHLDHFPTFLKATEEHKVNLRRLFEGINEESSLEDIFAAFALMEDESQVFAQMYGDIERAPTLKKSLQLIGINLLISRFYTPLLMQMSRIVSKRILTNELEAKKIDTIFLKLERYISFSNSVDTSHYQKLFPLVDNVNSLDSSMDFSNTFTHHED